MKTFNKFSANKTIFITILFLSILLVMSYLRSKKIEYSNEYELKNEYSNNNKIITIDNDNVKSKYLFCLIKTTPEALKTNKTLTVYNVWASRCNNYLFVTLIPDELLNKSTKYGEHREIQMPFFLLQPEGLKVFTFEIVNLFLRLKNIFI